MPLHQKHPGKLSALFKSVVVSGALLAGAVFTACRDNPVPPPAPPPPSMTEQKITPPPVIPPPEPPRSRSRPFTEGEAVLAKDVFSGAKTEDFRIVQEDCRRQNVPMEYFSNLIRICSPDHYSDDYSLEDSRPEDVKAFKNIVHDMVVKQVGWEKVTVEKKEKAWRQLKEGERWFTAGERAILYSIFGDRIRVEDAKIITGRGCTEYGGASSWAHARTTSPRSFEICKAEYDSSDYSQGGIYGFEIQVHEGTHMWQWQEIGYSNWRWCPDRGNNPTVIYAYQLDINSSFKDFCIEDQASIIADYGRAFLRPEHAPRRIANTPFNMALLQKVVETEFPNARLARLEFEAQEGYKVPVVRLDVSAINQPRPPAPRMS